VTTIKRGGWTALAFAAALWGSVSGAAAQATGGGAGGETMAESTAREQDLTDQQARAHFSVGRAMYDSGRFAEAANEFQQAYDLSHRPSLLYNLFIAYRDSSQTLRARDALRLYLTEVAEAPNRGHLEARLAALDAQVAELEAAEQHRAELDAQRAQAEQAAAEAEAARQAAEERARQALERRSRPWWPWLLAGAGVAIAGAGAGVAVDAQGQADSLRAMCPNRVCQGDPTVDGPTEPLTRRPGIQTQAAVADALWIGGATIAVTGLVLAFLVDDDVEHGAPAASAGCGPTGCSATLRLTF
jgi:hypothetical protein